MSPPYEQRGLITPLEHFYKSCTNRMGNRRCTRIALCTRSKKQHATLVRDLIYSWLSLSGEERFEKASSLARLNLCKTCGRDEIELAEARDKLLEDLEHDHNALLSPWLPISTQIGAPLQIHSQQQPQLTVTVAEGAANLNSPPTQVEAMILPATGPSDHTPSTPQSLPNHPNASTPGLEAPKVTRSLSHSVLSSVGDRDSSISPSKSHTATNARRTNHERKKIHERNRGEEDAHTVTDDASAVVEEQHERDATVNQPISEEQSIVTTVEKCGIFAADQQSTEQNGNQNTEFTVEDEQEGNAHGKDKEEKIVHRRKGLSWTQVFKAIMWIALPCLIMVMLWVSWLLVVRETVFMTVDEIKDVWSESIEAKLDELKEVLFDLMSANTAVME